MQEHTPVVRLTGEDEGFTYRVDVESWVQLWNKRHAKHPLPSYCTFKRRTDNGKRIHDARIVLSILHIRAHAIHWSAMTRYKSVCGIPPHSMHPERPRRDSKQKDHSPDPVICFRAIRDMTLLQFARREDRESTRSDLRNHLDSKYETKELWGPRVRCLRPIQRTRLFFISLQE